VKGSRLVNRRQASPSHEPRSCDVGLLVLHYTGMETAQRAVDWLCNPISKVSCHYLVDVDGSIVQMVDEDRRAWHAGTSSWHGQIDINSASIGIEIQNLGHTGGLPPFPKVQMERVAALCLDIMLRFELSPHHVVAHSDVAPGRKIDPGENFDWDFLAERGVGQMVFGQNNLGVVETFSESQRKLQNIGYGLETTGQPDNRTRIVVEALQRRYRRGKVDGKLDEQTLDILKRLKAIQTVTQFSAG
jgi:N-acetylmuramoyl-L-alanine amidase